MNWLSLIPALISAASLIASLAMASVVAWHMRRPHGVPAPLTDGLTVIVPIKGADAHTERLLTRLVRSELNRPFEVLFAMESTDDPAYAVCTRVVAAHPDRAVRIVVTGPADGLMGKQHNLKVASRQAQYPLLGSMDADVAIDPNTLETLLNTLATPGTGTAYPLPFYEGRAPLGGTLVSLYTNFFFIPNMGAWAATGAAPFVIGALWLARHQTLRQAGGFGQFGQTVTDDAIIGRNVRRLGLRNRLAPAVVAMPAENLDWLGGIQHLRKWLGMLRAEGAAALFTSLATWYPLFWAALAAGLGVALGEPQALWLLPIAIVIRCGWAALLNTAVFRLPPLHLVAPLLVFELLAPLLLVLPALFRDTVTWKGRHYRIGKGGRILAMSEELDENLFS